MKQILCAVVFILIMLVLQSCDSIPLWGNDDYVDRNSVEQNTPPLDLKTESSDNK